jgi:hypothetical protein
LLFDFYMDIHHVMTQVLLEMILSLGEWVTLVWKNAL